MSNAYINTYTQIHIHFVFAVKFRKALIDRTWNEELHKYITGIIQNKNHKMLVINTMPDHLHMLVGFRPHDSMSEVMKVVKEGSQDWINDKHCTHNKFKWQESFGAFSHTKSQVPGVIKYILNQKQHHHKQTFLEEYISILDAFGIEYDKRYIFKELID